MASMVNLIVFLFTIALNIYKSQSSSCSFSINATAQTPFRFNNLTTRSPDCDDTAIIINDINMSDSLIAGTLKKGGLELYTLNGNLLQSIPAPNPPNNDSNNKPGRFNNVAAIKCLSCSDSQKKLVIVTDRGLDQLRFYMLNDTTGLLDDVTSPNISYVFSANQTIVNKQQTAYGLTATTYGGIMRALVSKEHQNIVAVVEIMQDPDNDGLFTYDMPTENDYITLPLTFNLNGMNWTQCVDTEGRNPQIEGMAVDPDDGTVLIGQEDVGLFKTSLNKKDNEDYNITLIDVVQEFGVDWYLGLDDENETECIWNYTMDYYAMSMNTMDNTLNIRNDRNLFADVEGLALYADNMTNGGGYYVVSCQGAGFYNIYSRYSFMFMGNFSIYYKGDKTLHTDGVDIESGSFGNKYPDGIIIVQDQGENGMNITMTNFKISSFEHILDAIEECDEDMNSTSFYTTVNTDSGDNNDSGETGGSTTIEDHKTTILILGIVFGVLFVVGIALCLYFSCFQNCGGRKVDSPDNYVELQNK